MSTHPWTNQSKVQKPGQTWCLLPYVFVLCRFCQMMWRLNFLVIFCCIVLQNSYMLYYICPMHTIFTVFVYASLGIASHLNKTPAWMWTK